MMIKDPSILMVDDDESYYAIMKQALGMAKMPGSLIWLEDGETALSHLEKAAKNETSKSLPHLILLDVNMPRMNGFEFLSSLRENEALHALPVLMLSVSQAASDVRRSYRTGANAYLAKPTDFKKLQDMLAAIYHFWFRYALLPAPEPSS